MGQLVFLKSSSWVCCDVIEKGIFMQFTKEQCDQINADAKGKVVKSLKRTASDGGYWTMTFTDGSEISFRLMAEVSNS